MKIEYLYEAGVFGSYKKERSTADTIKSVEKDLTHVVKSAFLDRYYIKIEELINEYLSKQYDRCLSYYNNGLILVGKNGSKKGKYRGWNGLENAIPIFRLAIENNTIVIIMSCIPENKNRIAISGYFNGDNYSWFSWINGLKNFLNSNIERITETGLSFNYDGFDVKLEMDPDIIDNDGRVNVNFMSFTDTKNIDVIQQFVDYFYNKDIRIKADIFKFNRSMSSNEMYQQYIERFPDLIRSTHSIHFDMSVMKEFDLENLHITSVLADPNSNVKIYYELPVNGKLPETYLHGIEKFIHNEYNMTLEKFKEIAYKNKEPYDTGLRKPEDIKKIKVCYRYNNPKNIVIKGT